MVLTGLDSATGHITGERKWGLARPVLRGELLFQKAFYYYLMASNLVLRLAWTYKLSPHLRRNHDTVFAFTLLEARAAPIHSDNCAAQYPVPLASVQGVSVAIFLDL